MHITPLRGLTNQVSTTCIIRAQKLWAETNIVLENSIWFQTLSHFNNVSGTKKISMKGIRYWWFTYVLLKIKFWNFQHESKYVWKRQKLYRIMVFGRPRPPQKWKSGETIHFEFRNIIFDNYMFTKMFITCHKFITES